MAFRGGNKKKGNQMKTPLAEYLCSMVAAGFFVAFNSQAAMTLTVDEYGNGTFDDGLGNVTQLSFSVSLDPTTGGHTTLNYNLPYSVVAPGDVVITNGIGQPTDLFRFTGTTMFIYSFISVSDPPKPGNLADTGLPSSPIAGYVSLPENGPLNGANGYFNYVPTSNPITFTYGPGYTFNPPVTGVGQPAYNLIVTQPAAVPEPATISLLSFTAVAGVLALRKRRSLR